MRLNSEELAPNAGANALTASGDPRVAHVRDIFVTRAKNIMLSNEAGEEIPSRTIRYLITKDLQLITNIDRRMKNDYVIHVGDEGVIDIYEL